MTLPVQNLDLTGYITRTSLALPALVLFQPSTDPGADPTVNQFDTVQNGLAPGAIVKRRQIAESMFVDDAFQLQSSKARIAGTFGFFVTGHDSPSLQASAALLLAAIDQPSWNIHVKFDNVTDWAWSCWDAEPDIGLPIEAYYGLWMPISVSVMRSPIPVSGPF